MSATVIESVKAVFTRRENEKATTYGQLVASLAGDEKIDPESVASILQTSGKSVDDLAGDVDRIKRRRQAAETIAELEPQAKALREQWSNASQQARDDREAARKKYETDMQAVDRLDGEASALEKRVKHARRTLAELTPVELLNRQLQTQTELAAVGQKIGAANGRLSGLRRTVHELGQQLTTLRAAYGETPNGGYKMPLGDVKGLKAERAAAQAEIPELKNELSRLESEKAKLQNELATIESEILST